jgi:hypothetical protein
MDGGKTWTAFLEMKLQKKQWVAANIPTDK